MSTPPRGAPDVRALRRALEPGGGGGLDATTALEDATVFRGALADPLGAHARSSVPDAALRAQLVERPEAVLAAAPGRGELRLAADTVSVAVALSDELGINEGDAAVLLRDARGLLMKSEDRDVVAAAKEMYFGRRRELVLFLQELLRVHLLSGDRGVEEDVAFHDALIRERDALFVEGGLFENLVGRIGAGLESLAAPTASNPRPGVAKKADVLAGDEAVLLAECLFLLAYSVQVTSGEALAVRDLLEKLVALVAGNAAEEEAAARRHHPAGFASFQQVGHGAAAGGADHASSASATSIGSSFISVRASTVRNLVFLSWTCCLDRSRYSDLYDPRTGASGVNALLRDLVFVKRTCSLPPLAPESLDDPSTELAPVASVLAAAELGGAIFRMAIAEPDKDEAILAVLRTCAFSEALEFLSVDLADWIETGAGSLLPDANLYADVFEDFAFDLSEAPDVAQVLFRYTQDEVLQAAATAPTSYSAQNPDGGVSLLPAIGSAPMGTGGFHSATPRRFATPQHAGGKPPKPPAPGRSPYGGSGVGTPDNPYGRSGRFPPLPGGTAAAGTNGEAASKKSGMDHSATAKPKNLVALLGMVVVRAVKLAPGKLVCESLGGGQRYWAGLGAESVGVISRMAECVLDMYDAAFRNPEADSPFAEAFNGALLAFLKVLSVTAVPGGDVPHAASSLRFLCHSGHSMVSMDRAMLALNHHYDVLAMPGHGNLSQISEFDTTFLIGLLEIIAHCADSLQPQGGMSPILGRSATEIAPRVTALALLDVPFKLRASLVRTLMALGDNRSSLMFLDEITKNKLAKLRQMIRGQEAEHGSYDATVAILELAAQSCTWSPDEYSNYAVQNAALFAVDEVVTHWCQRKYCSDGERWRVMRVASDLLLAIIAREQRDGNGYGVAYNVISRLLCPAPGTGAASPALRAFISCTGLRRISDDGRGRSMRNSSAPSNGGNDVVMHLFQMDGRESLGYAASIGDGESFREMELTAAACSRVLTFTLSLSPSQFATHAMVTARASDLLLSEPKALVAAGSLVFAVDECTPKPSPFRLGYSSSTCAAILEMLASAASQSTLICKLLTRSDEPAASTRFRCSLADVVASYSVANGISRVNEDWLGDSLFGDESRTDESPLSAQDRPRMFSALHLVEACLGMDGGGKPGLYLLGLVMDVGDRLQNAQYGVLSALMELVSGVGEGASNRVDGRSRATAAVFLERLAGNTTAKTSCAVLDFIRNVGAARPSRDPADVSGEVTVWGFGDVMLSRILDFYDASLPDSENIDWASLGELTGACMKLSALLVRQFPGEEEELFSKSDQSGMVSYSGRPGANGQIESHGPMLPSPDSLLRLVASVAGNGKTSVALHSFQLWHQLVSARLDVHPQGRGYGSIPLLLDISASLLDALGSVDRSSDLRVLAAEDGGTQAASVILRCLGRIALVATSQMQSPDEFLGDSQAGVLLSKVMRAVAGSMEGRGDTVQTRTSLYAAFLVCGQLSETKSSDESIAQAFAGRVGSRHTSGAEALVSSACEDAVAGPSAATRSVALVCLSVAARLDPLRVVPALSLQNRLRRVVSSALAETSSQAKVVRNCLRLPSVEDDGSSEKSAVVVAESALCLIHAVAGSIDGARALSDAACLESVASLMGVLCAPRQRTFGDDENGDIERKEIGARLFGKKALLRSDDAVGARPTMRFGDGDDSELEGEEDGEMGDLSMLVEGTESPEERCASVAGILTAAVAAAVVGSDSILVDGALACLHAGEILFARLIRGLDRPKKVYMSTVGHMAMVLSRIPPRILSDGAVPANLRALLACHVGSLVPSSKAGVDIGASGSPLSIGLSRAFPRDARDARRCQIEHPEGGSLFERDMVAARTECLKCVFAALRRPMGLLMFFAPRLGSRQLPLVEEYPASSMSGFVDDVTGRQGDLGDVLWIARTAIDAMQHSAEESIRLISMVADEGSTALSARKLAELSPFCREELDLQDDEPVTGRMALSCLRSAAQVSRVQADACVAIVESALYILREYTNAAGEAVRGNTYGAEECPLSVRDAELLIDDAQTVLLPLCQEIDALSVAMWGREDPSFSRQLGRQIRTNITPR